ncbi:MAG: DUF4358 domain-containing protein [Clostridium butyricum]|nr:DUF4358 domain-containing protein [Clostridium butyricum]
MRKILGKIITIVMIIGMITGCSNSVMNKDKPRHVSTAEVVEKIKSGVELRATQVVEGDMLSENFHLNMDDVEEATIETGVVNTGIETIAVAKAKDGKVDSVKEAFEKVIEDKRANAFYPGESEAIDDAEIKNVGNYVGLFIIPDYEQGNKNSAEKAVDIFEEALR